MSVTLMRPSRARQMARRVFLVSSVASLYTASCFGVLLHVGLAPAIACLAAACTGMGVASLASIVLQRADERERRERIAHLLFTEPAAAPAPPPIVQPESGPEPIADAGVEAGFARAESRERRESREIQAALLPRSVPAIDGYQIEAAYEPCGDLGGDFYDFLPRGDGTLLMTLGDVSGKGPPGAIVMAMVQTLFRQNVDRAEGPADLLRRVNRGFAGTLGKGVFVTALACSLDAHRHRFTLAGAGHHPLLLLNPAERRATQVSAPGLALGLVEGNAFDQSLVETTIDLAEGDSLLLYTDGATECAQEISKGVGEGRFLAAAAAAVLGGPGGALDRLRADLWQAGGRRDDTTLLLVSRLPQDPAERAGAARTTSQVNT